MYSALEIWENALEECSLPYSIKEMFNGNKNNIVTSPKEWVFENVAEFDCACDMPLKKRYVMNSWDSTLFYFHILFDCRVEFVQLRASAKILGLWNKKTDENAKLKNKLILQKKMIQIIFFINVSRIDVIHLGVKMRNLGEGWLPLVKIIFLKKSLHYLISPSLGRWMNNQNYNYTLLIRSDQNAMIHKFLIRIPAFHFNHLIGIRFEWNTSSCMSTWFPIGPSRDILSRPMIKRERFFSRCSIIEKSMKWINFHCRRTFYIFIFAFCRS